MKKKTLFLFTILIIVSNYGFSQNKFDSKEDAIAVIKANYLFMYFGYPEDTIMNIARFAENINKIIPLDKEKSCMIKTLILSEIKQTEKKMSVNHVLGMPKYNLPNFIPLMGINANDVIKAGFCASDYEKIYDILLKDRMNARTAYLYLSRLYSDEKYRDEGIILVSYSNPKYLLDRMFKDYSIKPIEHKFVICGESNEETAN